MAALYAGVAVVLGGGGSPEPVPELLLQVLGAGVAIVWLLGASSDRAIPAAPRQAWWLAGILLALPLLQIVPLPPAIWHALPGRETERAALALVGAEQSWRSITIDPGLTLAGLCALFPPALLLVMTASLNRSGRSTVVAVIVAMAALGLVVGAAQVAGGEDSFFRLYDSQAGVLNGFQANRNSQADMLLIALVGAIATLREVARRPRGVVLTPGLCLVLTLGIVVPFSIGVGLTGSRAGIALLPVAWLAVAVLIRPWLVQVFPARRTYLVWGGLAAMALVGGAIALEYSPALARVLRRFDFIGESRPEIWKDTVWALRGYWPFGSGLGTFSPAYLAAERLEVVDGALTNRAHNDYLEFALEGGIFALIIGAVVVAVVLRLMWRGRHTLPAGSVAQFHFANAALTVVALHSIVDYPLRSISLACVAAVCLGLLIPARHDGEPGGLNV